MSDPLFVSIFAGLIAYAVAVTILLVNEWCQ